MANYNHNRRTGKFSPILNTTERNALTGLVGGEIIYNTTTGYFERYNGASWTQDLMLNGQVTQSVSGEIIVTVPDNNNTTGITINQNDVTNNGKAFVITNTGSGISLDVDGSSNLDGAVTINDSGAAVNFTVKSDLNAGMLFVDGTNNRVGIGTATPANPLELNLGGQDWGFNNRSDSLTIQGQTSASTAFLEIYSKDGDGTDNVGMNFYNLGTPSAITNREKLSITVSSTQAEIFTEADGTGTLRPLVLYTEGNTDQLKLNIDASLLLTVGGQGYQLKDRSDSLSIQGQTSATNSILELFNKDGDGTDTSEISIFDLGTPADITDSESLNLYKNSTSSYIISSATGTGTVRPLIIQTGSNTNQLKLNTDASILLTVGGQAYQLINDTNTLTLQSQTVATDSIFELFNKDGDGTDVTGINIYDKGTPGSITDRERIQIYKNSTAGYILTEADGTGTLRPLIIQTEGNTNQLYLDTSGRVGIGLTPTANMAGLSVEAGLLTLKETTTPTADSGYGKIYTKSDDKLYFQDGSGTEKEIITPTKLTDTVNNEAKVIETFADLPDNAAKYEYLISDGTNMRMGILFLIWDGSADLIKISDISSDDIGDSSDFIWSADILADNVRLIATAINNYSIIKLNKFPF